jgi:hypothetical protein
MAAKVEIPEALKTEVPQTMWGRILLATPIVMTVIATMLAGLASSEMTRAQYDRSLAAQLQSKAGDQWGYAAAKKTRGGLAHNSLDLLVAGVSVQPLQAPELPGADPAVIAAFTEGKLPSVTMPKFDGDLKAALDALAADRPESEIEGILKRVSDATISNALEETKDAANEFDTVSAPINSASDKLDEQLMAGSPDTFRSFAAARLRYTGARYDMEAKLNQAVASMYEMQVRKQNISAEKHHARSTKFFFGMLAAQAAVIIATFSIAARKRNFLWSLAATAGAAAVGFSVYVYLFI